MKQIHFLIILISVLACKNATAEKDEPSQEVQETAEQTTKETYNHTGLPTVDVLYEGYVMPIEGKTFLPGAAPDGARKVGSTISLIRTNDMIMVMDPGMTAAGKWKGIIDKMKNMGIAPEDVTHVFISHHHPDHNTRLGVFPNATVVDFWATYKDDRWDDHPDMYEISEGVTIVKTPGHTHEDASMLVNTDEGLYFLTHLWWNDEFGPEVDPLAVDQSLLEENRAKFINQVDWIVPGHGKKFKNPKKINKE